MPDVRSARGCGCFSPRQASLVVSLTLQLLYGLAALALLVDLCIVMLHHPAGRAVQVAEVAAFGALLASLAGAALLGRAVTTGSRRLLLGWLAWHGTCWVLAALTAVTVAVTGALRAKSCPLVLCVLSVVNALALLLLAYCGLVVLRYYRLLNHSPHRSPLFDGPPDQEKHGQKHGKKHEERPAEKHDERPAEKTFPV